MCVCVLDDQHGDRVFHFAYQFSHANIHHLILTVLLSSYHHLRHHRTINDQIYLYCVCGLLKYLL